MKKYLILGLIVLVFSVGLVLAGGIEKLPAKVIPSETEIEVPQNALDSFQVIERVIVLTTSATDKALFRLKGCTILHELNDATALKCPKGITIKGAIPDRINRLQDLEADIQINADDVWGLGFNGTGVNVAVLDTGIDTNHQELISSIIGCKTFVTGTTCEDDDGHGTHVSGIITADGVNTNAKGVAPGAGIYMLKVCGPIGTNYGCYDSDMMAAMEFVVEGPDGVPGTEDEPNTKVMSISIGGGNFPGENCDSDTLAQKVNWVVSNGIPVVVAAGNDYFFVSSPACASEAIAVGAVNKSGFMANFSNFGPSLDIVAPGVNIYSSVIDGYASWSGTSMSTPMVSGTITLMLQAKPNSTVNDIKKALYETADPINPASVCYGVVKKRGPVYWIGVVDCSQDNYGAGIVDAYGAVTYVPPVCGNGIIEGTEQCDDINLGGATCKSLGFSSGTLACTASCTFDTSNCISPPSCSEYCISQQYSGGNCKKNCNPAKEVLNQDYTCSNAGQVCCCKL